MKFALLAITASAISIGDIFGEDATVTNATLSTTKGKGKKGRKNGNKLSYGGANLGNDDKKKKHKKKGDKKPKGPDAPPSGDAPASAVSAGDAYGGSDVLASSASSFTVSAAVLAVFATLAY